MEGKVYIWGFPGIGKSSVRSSLSVVDADCKLFQFDLSKEEDTRLHREEGWGSVASQTDFPRNYLEYVQNVDADIVLLNCHPSFFKDFDQERLLLVYPSPELKDEYLLRYRSRGDHPSFISHMEESFEDIIACVQQAPFRKYEITQHDVTLQNLLDGGILMSQFITKKELTELIAESVLLGVYMPDDVYSSCTPAELAQLMFDGEVPLELDILQESLHAKKAEMEKERMIRERRGGLTHEELRDKILQGIVNGTFSIYHGEIAPYSHGFEVKYPNDYKFYTNRWECYCSFEAVSEAITQKIEGDFQNNQVFSGTKVQPVDIKKILEDIEAHEKSKITSFVEEAKSGLERRGRYTGHVANLKDVHSGLALDGIILGHFQGDYSSITTSSQNDLMRTLVALKGFCLDAVDRLGVHNRELVVVYLKKHGTDISTPEKLKEWINANPDKCALPENRDRKPSLASKLQDAHVRQFGDAAKTAPENEVTR